MLRRAEGTHPPATPAFPHEPPAEVERYPTLYFQVFGLESWNRHVPCGYGYYVIPATAGSAATLSLPTWRPLGSAYSNMHAFFLGGGPECKDVEWVGTSYSSCAAGGALSGGKAGISSPHPPAHPAVLNRAGVATQTSGTLEIACHTLQQRTWTMRRAREAHRTDYGSRSQLSGRRGGVVGGLVDSICSRMAC